MQTKAKKWPPSQTRVADRVRGPIWRGTWFIGQAHETEGSYPRPRGATVGRSRRYSPTALRGRACPRAPGVVSELSPALLRLPSVPPSTGRSPGHERRTSAGRPTTANTQPTDDDERPTNMNQGEREPRVSLPFVKRGSALRRLGLRPSLRPVRGSTSLRGVSRRLSKGGVPPLRPPHAVPPPMGSELPCPLPVPALAPQRGAQTRALAQVSLLRLWLVGLKF